MPSILSLKKKYKIAQMTIVADAAMISNQNVEFLKAEKLNYIVAARTANLPIKTIEEIAKKLNQKERREMEKQLAKAEFYLKNPSAAEIIKRTKFLKEKKLGYELNQDLICKTTLLLGIKGYYSNCSNLTDQEIIKNYKNLWRVEQAFRISKSDLKARPIFHSKQQTIEAHILICFMALAISKYIEIKSQKSIKAVTKLLKKTTDARIFDQINKKEVIMKGQISNELKEILKLI